MRDTMKIEPVKNSNSNTSGGDGGGCESFMEEEKKKEGVKLSSCCITMTKLIQQQKSASIFKFSVLLLLLVAHPEQLNCQSSNTNYQLTTLKPPTISERLIKNVTLPERVIETTTTTTTPSPQTSPLPLAVPTTTTGGEILLSGNEFVDFTEAPIVLFDGLSNEKTTANDTATSTTSNVTSSLQVPNPTTIASIETTTSLPPNGTNSLGELATATEKPPVVPTTTTTTTLVVGEEEPTTTTTVEGESPEETLGGDDYETLDEAKEPAKQTFEPPKNVSQYMDYIERLFHDLRHQITDLFEPHIPQLIRTSQMVQLSGSCSYDMLRMALALRQFEPWALRMIDSSGKVPEGIFEGSFTALGSYDECLNTVFASSGSSNSGGAQQSGNNNQQQHGSTQQPTQGKYCLVNVSPFMPPKPPADRVELMFQEEANRRNYTKDDQFSRLSPMFYYMKFRIGVCIPSSCVESDMDSISSALSSSLRLNITIPHCRVKHDQPITRAQLVGGLAFALVAMAVLGATVMDYWRRRLERLNIKDNILVFNVGHDKSMGAPLPKVLLSNFDSSAPTVSGGFNERFCRHWSWMSFSLLTNYKLHFTYKRPPPTLSGVERQKEMASTPIVRCLNGIRVLSLCWVIVANSYITLDPRATKRLARTREAPKDFLFQLVAQASLAIETFFFLSGILVSMSFARKLNPPPSGQRKEPEANKQPSEQHDNGAVKNKQQQQQQTSSSQQPSYLIQWIHFYVHRYIRMTPATMLVIAFTMFAFRYGDGPLWFEATHKAHMSCSENWWRHLLHVANFIDTRQMCFIHYWYIAADMQLFLFAPLLMFLIYQRRRIGYAVATLIGLASFGFVFYTTYIRNLPPTLLFYNSDPESRREFGNTIMTKPLTHALPYMVGMLVGKWLTNRQVNSSIAYRQGNRSLATLLGLIATMVALAEVFLPYKWNNSHLPTRFLAALYAAIFRFCWSLALAYLVIACAHPPGRRCRPRNQTTRLAEASGCQDCSRSLQANKNFSSGESWKFKPHTGATTTTAEPNHHHHHHGRNISTSEGDTQRGGLCLCGSGGNIVNRLLSLSIFTHLSKLSFVAYLIHLPLMSVFISQTRGLFAFSHTLVIHLALSYLVMAFLLSFVLVHIIEFPFLTFERYLFERLFYSSGGDGGKHTQKEAEKFNGIGHRTTTDSSKGGIRKPKSSDNGSSRVEEGFKRNYNGVEDNSNSNRSRQDRRSSNVNNQVVGLQENSDGGVSRDKMRQHQAASYRNHNGGETFKISERL